MKVYPPPAVSLGSDKHLCPGDTLVLDPGQDYAGYSWTGGSVDRTIRVSVEGSYKIIVTDDRGCQNDDKVYVFLDASIPALDLGADASYCKGKEPSLATDAAYDDYTWNTGAASGTINITETGKYWVNVSNNNTVCEETDTVNIVIQKPYNDEKICIVTIDLATGKNMVVWEKTSDVGTMGYHIYREKTIGNYEIIGQVMNTELSIFKDTLVSPENQSYIYKITSVDTCGNESEIGEVPYHKPIFLKYVSSDNGINLEWTNYAIEGVSDLGDYLTSFEIYRGSDSTSLELYKQVGSINNYTDTDPDALVKKYYYRVAGVLKDPCSPTNDKKAGTGPFVNSLSNLDDNKLKETDTTTSVMSLHSGGGFAVYPNPFSEYTSVILPNTDRDEYSLILYDMAGKPVLIKEAIRENIVEINRDQLPAGYYTLVVNGPRLFRGRLIIK